MKPPPGEWAVLDLVTPLPLTVAADVMRAVHTGMERAGYAVFVRESTGIGRIWVRFPAHDTNQSNDTAAGGQGAPDHGRGADRGV